MRGLSLVLAVAAAIAVQAQTPAPNPAAANNPNAKFIPALMAGGASNVASIVYVGKGMAAVPGPSGQLAAGPAMKFTARINYGLMSTAVEIERPAAPKKLAQFMANDVAWDVVDGKTPALNPTGLALRQILLYMTPHGAIKAAFDARGKRTMANETTPDGKTVTTFTFLGGASRYKAYLDDDAMVTKVQTLPGDPVFGNLIVEFLFSGYKDVDTFAPSTVPAGSVAAAYHDIMAPTHLIEKINGNTVLDVAITEVRPNAAGYLEVPESIEKTKAAAKK